MEDYEFVVVGSGSGLDVANVAANQGRSVAVIEKGPLGGTCLNRGCIPSKQLLYHADVKTMVDRAEEFHIDATVESVDFQSIVEAVNAEVAADADSIRRGLQSSDGHTLVEGEAEFTGERTLGIVDGPDEGMELRGETVLIAAGSRPTIPPIDGIEDVDYLTSREALQLEAPPEDLVIVGGGYVAAELAHFFGVFGSEVTIIGRRPQLLPDADPDVAAAFTDRYRERFTVHTGYAATAVEDRDSAVAVSARPSEDGGAGVDEGASVTVTGEAVLVAAGRRPNTDVLNVEAAGVETDEEGFVRTDEFLRTSADDVWALGDIVGAYLLKHNANHEARTVVQNIFGSQLTPIDYEAMPFAVFAAPEVAGVGVTEDDLEASDREYATNTYRFERTARGDAMHAQGFVKALIDVDGEILGCHVIGPDASTLIQEVVVAMKSGSGMVTDIRDAVHIHPALPEVVHRAFSGQFHRPGTEHAHDH